MTRAILGAGTIGTIIVVLTLVARSPTPERHIASANAVTPPTAATQAGAVAQDGLLYGRITTDDGVVREGRLRWGGDQEALWSNYFNGAKKGNAWAPLAPREQLPKDRVSIGLFGKEIVGWDNVANLGRPFMTRFGDIARIEPRGRDLYVTLKSGTVVHIARYGADDMNDGVRVWNATGSFVDIEEWGIRTIEFLPTPPLGAAAAPLRGTVRTRAGTFTGLVQWDRRACIGSDELTGMTTDGIRSVRFDAIRAIARRSGDGSVVTLLDGSEIVLSGTRAVSSGNSGIYVDDQRYGRVLVSWEAFERVDFSAGATAPAYSDFQAGRALTGDVVTRSGRRLAGRLVFDLDESETTETLDAPSQGVDYTIPFHLIASIEPGGRADRAERASVTLLGGEVLRLERWGDLGAWNAGILVFLEGRGRPEHVSWADVERIDFARAAKRDSTGGPR